jgi:hypothetical protein
MDKNEKRKEIIAALDKSNNDSFSLLLEKKKTNIIELDVLERLEGNINLGILLEKGFNQIEILRFSPGNIISLTNIPQGIKTLTISDNLLEEIELPDSIEYIDLAHNCLKGEIDFIRNTLLSTIQISYNQITSIVNLSESLEELFCDHNLLHSLDLKNTPKLRTLHCNYNDAKLVLNDLPDTLIDTRFPENIIQTDNKKTKTPKNYLDSVRTFFNYKNRYENDWMELKKKAKKSKKTLKTSPKCIGCARNVGMIFSSKDQKYLAYCGDTSKPCDWKILIHRGDHYSFLETMKETNINLEETKENIIRQKMDTLFQYITEQKSADLFKKQLSFFKANSEMVEKYYQNYLDIYFNVEKREIINLKKKKIQELLVELQSYIHEEEWSEMVRIQYKEISPISKYIQNLQYPMMTIEKEDIQNGSWILDQREIILSDLEINHGEPLSVENVGKKRESINTPE